MDFSSFTFRAHMVGYLMPNAKGKSNLQKYNEAQESYDKKNSEYQNLSNKNTAKSDNLLENIGKLSDKIDYLEPRKDFPHLGIQCKSKLAEIYTTATTGREKEIKAKYLEKGLLLEEDAITAYCMFTGLFHKKNKVRKFNKWIEGELDVSEDDCITDTKVSWDIFTFDANRFKVINPIYEWQLDCYMWLDNKSQAKLAYVLLNTPEHMIQAEERKLKYELFGSETNYDCAPEQERNDYKEACLEIRNNHIYDDLPDNRKIQIYHTYRSEERIERIKKRIEECRLYLNNIENPKNIEDEEE